MPYSLDFLTVCTDSIALSQATPGSGFWLKWLFVPLLLFSAVMLASNSMAPAASRSRSPKYDMYVRGRAEGMGPAPVPLPAGQSRGVAALNTQPEISAGSPIARAGAGLSKQWTLNAGENLLPRASGNQPVGTQIGALNAETAAIGEQRGRQLEQGRLARLLLHRLHRYATSGAAPGVGMIQPTISFNPAAQGAEGQRIGG